MSNNLNTNNMNTVNLKADAATAQTTATKQELDLISVKTRVQKGTEFQSGSIEVSIYVSINESVLDDAGKIYGFARLKDTPEVRKHIKSTKFTELVRSQLSKFAHMNKEEFGDWRNPNYNEAHKIISKIVGDLAEEYGFYSI